MLLFFNDGYHITLGDHNFSPCLGQKTRNITSLRPTNRRLCLCVPSGRRVKKLKMMATEGTPKK